MALLLKELGLKPEELMAIGDGENDVEMLQVRHLRLSVNAAGL